MNGFHIERVVSEYLNVQVTGRSHPSSQDYWDGNVTASFSASLQNNHHHFPHFLRTSHDSTEYDFGFLTTRAMKALGLVKATVSGAQKPEGISLQEVGF